MYSLLSPPQGSRILFIGNSLTFSNDIPAHLQAMSIEILGRKRRFNIRSASYPGVTLKWHADGNGEGLRLLREQKWDFVVIQEQSVASRTPIKSQADHTKLILPWNILLDEVKKNGATPILYSITVGWYTPEDLVTIDNRLCDVSKRFNATISPVSKVVRQLEKSVPNFRPYQSDNHHFNNTGAYVAATTLLYSISRGLPEAPLHGRAEEYYLYERLFLADEEVINDATWRELKNIVKDTPTSCIQ